MQQVADVTAAQGAAPAAQGSGETLLEHVLSSLDNDKAEDVRVIDMRGRSIMADHMVVCSGRSARQVVAIAEKLADRLKRALRLTVTVDGKATGDWVLIDAGDVVVHVFRPEVRDFYEIEKMWQSGAPAPDAV